jgi:hypothetical protein
MPAELKTVHRSAFLGNADELSAVGNGGATASFSPSSGPLPSIPYF